MSTGTIRRPLFARLYPQMSKAMDHAGMTEHRDAQLSGLAGLVVEVGAGNGASFAHYPARVTRVLAIEPEPQLRDLARTAATDAPVSIETVDGIAEHVPVADGCADAVVFSLTLCSVTDLEAALAEAFRVLRPGGQLRFLEHGCADAPGIVRIQRLLDATVWPRLMGGCHIGRDTVAAISAAGFEIDHIERFLFPPARTPFSFHTLGAATRPRDNEPRDESSND